MKLHTLAAALFGALLFTLPGTASAMPIAIVENGELLGADNVEVNGTLFDVRFRDGTCSAIFSGCDNASEDFAFADEASAQAAAQALLDQVFLDGPDGLFDTDPELTSGCAIAEFCFANIPFALSSGGLFDFAFAQNFAPDISGDVVGNNVGSVDFDFSDNGFAVYAVFTPAGPSVAVPEPANFLIFGLGLAGLAGAGRHRRKGKGQVSRSSSLDPNRTGLPVRH